MAVADKLVNYISKISRKTYKKKIDTRSFKNIGSFGSIFDLSSLKMNHPLIVSSTDGVGTKIEIANQVKKYNTIGIDLVAMCVNDLIVQGAKPIFFLDYIAINKLKLNKVKKILDGIVSGCKLSECALIGGETAEMPGTYSKNKFDLAGFAVGLVEKKNLLTKNFEGIIPFPMKSNSCSFFTSFDKLASYTTALKLFLTKYFSYSVLENLLFFLNAFSFLIILLKEFSESLMS